ncbi:hypothetical protein, partial [Mycolicibacterium hodleri]|uniref:hypothetical protein n=1 Tax=Mycolicibacterium hodleri TaxID=49897 RepID=UPI0021F3719F
QTKTTRQNQVHRKSEKSDIQQPVKTGKKNKTIHKQQEDGKSPTKMAKNNKQKPPNTLLSSQTTRPTCSHDSPAAKSR